MVRRQIYDNERFAHFVTFSCYRRRRLLDYDRAKKIVLGVLNSQLARQAARLIGSVIMPWSGPPLPISSARSGRGGSSAGANWVKKMLKSQLTAYQRRVGPDDPFWQRKYDAFPIKNRHKLVSRCTLIDRLGAKLTLA